jgi:hypothetical protein
VPNERGLGTWPGPDATRERVHEALVETVHEATDRADAPPVDPEFEWRDTQRV